jgi:hypothetical protein
VNTPCSDVLTWSDFIAGSAAGLVMAGLVVAIVVITLNYLDSRHRR